ncbi:MAG TPA: right-handed parallel beta-helix repeat-containing protein [Phycisphaerales bacterium]|nr:right-handed parallel beta-helix repeat-containing protein [Phycisphaerales bacterium]HMP36868.1 right-handed parallel beta-helix repeat-containing protein [Phycisphaerales bacterium]
MNAVPHRDAPMRRESRLSPLAATVPAWFLLAAAAPCTLVAADLLVPEQFPTIQQAIGAAQTGDRVLVAPGTYVEAIDFLGKAIVVEGVAGAEETFIVGAGTPGYVVTIAGTPAGARAPETALRGFTVTGGLGQSAAPGGGIRVAGASVTIDACIVGVNSGIYGGGLDAFDAEVVILDSIFDANYAILGGGLAAEYSALTIERTGFFRNMGVSGGALYVGAVEAALRDVEFDGNASTQLGGAIYALVTTFDAARLALTDNGLAAPLEHPNGQVNGLVFSTLGGGAIYASNSSGRIDGARIVGNTAYAGGGIYVASGSAELEFVNALVVGSVAGLGAIYCNGASPRFVNCTIADNASFGVFTSFGSFPQVANSIITGHTSVGSTEIAGNGTTFVASSLVNGAVFGADIEGGVISASPLLDAEYVPLPGSPVIDAGSNALVPAGVEFDLLGNARIAPGVDEPGAPAVVDLGAIEFAAAPSDPPSGSEGPKKGDLGGGSDPTAPRPDREAPGVRRDRGPAQSTAARR